MIVDLETRLLQSPEELGPELSDAVRRLGASRWLTPYGSEDAHASATAGIDGAIVVGFRSAMLGARVDEGVLLRRIAASG